MYYIYIYNRRKRRGASINHAHADSLMCCAGERERLSIRLRVLMMMMPCARNGQCDAYFNGSLYIGAALFDHAAYWMTSRSDKRKIIDVSFLVPTFQSPCQFLGERSFLGGPLMALGS